MKFSHNEIVVALVNLVPNAQWHLCGDEFDSEKSLNLEWLDSEILQPNDETIFAKAEELKQ